MVGKTLPRKLVVLGDGACGKTSLLTVFTKGYFPTTYEPTVFENYVEIMSIEGQTVELSLWDTAGQEDFDRLRSLSYADTHVIMICFSVDMPDSLENVETKWIEEVNQFCPGVKIVLIALKCDLREDPTVREKLERRGMHTVTYDEGLAVARNIRANRYLECSAKHNRGVQEALHEAARVSISTKPKGNGGGPGGGGGGAKGDRLGSCCVVQ
ncbi:small GTPase superfamily [Kockovaella imperatae]|uniref:GTP-binding protein RHO3 n=1 Tax=Kockovaella imperatae TaxID=4999 RepID=A0A1Y1UFS0_9TREE|nr:small GTPase superfamily [Kockovaella imperatae]ORX35915.1 small GTPase superfamily [Kockovaella imperatae]